MRLSCLLGMDNIPPVASKGLRYSYHFGACCSTLAKRVGKYSSLYSKEGAPGIFHLDGIDLFGFSSAPLVLLMVPWWIRLSPLPEAMPCCVQVTGQECSQAGDEVMKSCVCMCI